MFEMFGQEGDISTVDIDTFKDISKQGVGELETLLVIKLHALPKW